MQSSPPRKDYNNKTITIIIFIQNISSAKNKARECDAYSGNYSFPPGLSPEA
jgi:hypothetical protein